MSVLDALTTFPAGLAATALVLWHLPAWVQKVLAALRDFESYRDERASRKRR